MEVPMISFLLCVCAAAFLMFVVRGFETGRASTRYTVAIRGADPVGFWAVQLFNLFFAAAALVGAIIAVRVL